MNAVYVRMILYFLAPIAAMIPGVEYISAEGTITIDVEVLALSMPAAIAAVGAIFAKWGKR